MRTAIVWICFFVAMASVQAQDTTSLNPNGYNRFYYPNKVLQSEGMLVNGKPEGIWKSYHENGILRSEGLRRGGKSDSTWKFFYDSGVLQSLIVYTDGNKKTQTDFYFNGNKISEEYFEKGIKNGTAIYFHESGTKSKELVYQNGKKEGTCIVFAEDDGSGCAAVMNLAAAFAEAKRQGVVLKRSVLFLLFTGEEKGLLGSTYFTENPPIPMEQTVANLNMDMI
ncbi:MAG: M28 family peptidase, partial [Bacteroidota bacterium]